MSLGQNIRSAQQLVCRKLWLSPHRGPLVLDARQHQHNTRFYSQQQSVQGDVFPSRQSCVCTCCSSALGTKPEQKNKTIFEGSSGLQPTCPLPASGDAGLWR